LDLVTIQVRNWKAAVRWYTETLGFEVAVSEVDDQFCLLTTRAAHLALAADHPEQSASTTENRVAPAFQVGDLDATLNRLRSEGVTIDPIIDGGSEGYRLARIWDPEGNRLHLYCYG
jgi:catechol 2,3-dioxygenase-like lactoylglutathione lyase family enzyme